jgi:group I intron endonuclease
MMDIIKQGVYCIRCIINDRVYIGSSINIEKRFREHKKGLATKTHSNYKLQGDWDRFGETCFEFNILEVTDFKLRVYLYDREQYHMNTTRNKYNLQNNAKAHIKRDPLEGGPKPDPRKKPQFAPKKKKKVKNPPQQQPKKKKQKVKKADLPQRPVRDFSTKELEAFREKRKEAKAIARQRREAYTPPVSKYEGMSYKVLIKQP